MRASALGEARPEQSLAREGGFALITLPPGAGKSGALRLRADRLGRLTELTCPRPHASPEPPADFHQEVGDLLGVVLRPHDRWAGFKTLRERWLARLDAPLLRPVLLLDHFLSTAGHPTLMTPEPPHALCEHALGNHRVLTTI